MMKKSYRIEFLTPCFCGGARPKETAEIRAPSIRGLVREWYRAAGGNDNEVFGSASGQSGCASRIKLRVKSEPSPGIRSVSLLPHKGGAKRPALLPQSFVLELASMKQNVGSWDEARRAVEIWLLLGCLGCRSNRAAGSVWNKALELADAAAMREELHRLRTPDRWDIRVSREADDPVELRRSASDTLNGYPHLFGTIRPRTPSPLKMKVIRLSGRTHLMFFSPSQGMIDEALTVLAGKRLGKMDWQRI